MRSLLTMAAVLLLAIPANADIILYDSFDSPTSYSVSGSKVGDFVDLAGTGPFTINEIEFKIYGTQAVSDGLFQLTVWDSLDPGSNVFQPGTVLWQTQQTNLNLSAGLNDISIDTTGVTFLEDLDGSLGFDFNVLSASQGTSVLRIAGTPNGNILTGSSADDMWARADFNPLQDSDVYGGFNTSLRLSGTTAVPEPTSASLFATIFCFLIGRRYRRPKGIS